MGQAKLRGSKEQRVKEGTAKREMTEKIRAESMRVYMDSLTDEEKAKIKKSKLMLASMLAMTAGLAR